MSKKNTPNQNPPKQNPPAQPKQTPTHIPKERPGTLKNIPGGPGKDGSNTPTRGNERPPRK